VLPGGLTLSAAGVISGTPTSAGTFPFTIQASSAGAPAQIATEAFSITIAPQKPILVTSTSAPSGYVGVNYSYTFTASGGLGNRTWSIFVGGLPPGLSLSPTGVLSGVPQVLGSFSFILNVADSSPIPQNSSRQYIMQIVPLSLVFTAQPVNTPHGQAFTAQVKLQDSFGNGIAGVPIDLTIGSGGAKIYDAVQDYSNNANPNGSWIYGSVQGLSGAGFATFATNLPATTCTNPPGGQCWTNGLSFPSTASIIQNTTPNSLLYSGTILQPPGVLNLLVENSFPTLRWVAPATDIYNIQGQFTRVDTSPSPVNVEIMQNGSSVLFTDNNYNDTFNPAPFSLTGVSLAVGTTIDFIAGPTAGPAGNSTGLEVMINGSGATLSGTTTAVTGANGVAVFSNISIGTSGAYALKASVPLANPALSNTFTIF
jgi:hypothetical protein